MNIDLIVHRQINARDILVSGDKWKELYDFFQEGVKKYGIYFYNYKDSPMPFYIGKCTAKSFNILGKVWDELDDCERGSTWLGRDISLLQEYEPFNEDDEEGNSLNPWKKLTGKNLKNRIKRFMNYITVTFTFVNMNEEARVVDKILTDLEVVLQERMIERNVLNVKWVNASNLNNIEIAKDYTVTMKYNIDGNYIIIDPSLFI